MQPWFMYNNIDSRDMGLWVAELPPATRPEERAETVTIPGMAGHLTVKEGDNVHESYLKECVVQVPYNADFEAILAWLCGEGKAVFSNEENRVYTAEITAEIKFDKVSNSLKQATIPFFVQPHKGQYPEEGKISFTGTSGSITNPGNVAARPLIKLTYTGSIEVDIGESAMAFTSAPGVLYIDCAARIVTTSAGAIWGGTYSGNFWTIEPGQNTITADHSCSLEITPRWRWK